MKQNSEKNVESPVDSSIQAAGGLVWRKTLLGVRIAVIHRRRYGDWCLPKGKPIAEETLEETAQREVREETGCPVRIISFAGATHYKVKGLPKTVFFWNMKPTGKGAVVDHEEVERVIWLNPLKALQQLDYPQERRLLAMALFEQNLGILSKIGYGLRPRRNRLASSLEAFRLELERHKDSPTVTEEESHWKDVAKDLLARAYTALDRKQLDIGWKCLLAAARMEIYGMNDDEQKARTVVLCKEAKDKLKGWRKEATLAVLNGSKDQGQSSSAERLYYATSLRDEHFTNQYFRMAYLRNQLVILLLILISTLIIVWAISKPEWFEIGPLLSDSTVVNDGQAAAVGTEEESAEVGTVLPSGKRFLIGIILFGVMGGAFSAIMSLSRTSTNKRIPEQIVDSYVTLLRPALGAAGALVVYIFLATKFLNINVSSGSSILAIAFVAGFSERLVVRGVRAVTGEEGREKSPS
jgi:8-oxo-dGTP diphosphatase